MPWGPVLGKEFLDVPSGALEVRLAGLLDTFESLVEAQQDPQRGDTVHGRHAQVGSEIGISPTRRSICCIRAEETSYQRAEEVTRVGEQWKEQKSSCSISNGHSISPMEVADPYAREVGSRK